MSREIMHFIGGRSFAGDSERFADVFDPNTGEVQARVMMRFVDLINRDMDRLARLLSSEHGKTVPDARGDIQRGLEVIAFSIGIPHLLKGEYSDSAGTGIDGYPLWGPEPAWP